MEASGSTLIMNPRAVEASSYTLKTHPRALKTHSITLAMCPGAWNDRKAIETSIEIDGFARFSSKTLGFFNSDRISINLHDFRTKSQLISMISE